jgi:hypothetical protein
LFTAAVLLGITWITFSRLLSEGIADHVYLFGRETLRAVQAWENHGFFAMAGFFPLGGAYFGANTFPSQIYQSYPPTLPVALLAWLPSIRRSWISTF